LTSQAARRAPGPPPEERDEADEDAEHETVDAGPRIPPDNGANDQSGQQIGKGGRWKPILAQNGSPPVPARLRLARQRPLPPQPTSVLLDTRNFNCDVLNCLLLHGPGKAQLPAQGHPRTIFRRALEHENLVLAEVTAREIGRVTIAEALELTALVAQKEPHRHPRVGGLMAAALSRGRPDSDESEQRSRRPQHLAHSKILRQLGSVTRRFSM
jgi:hypothetical protein